MKQAFFTSLSFKTGLVIVLVQTFVLALMGFYYLQRFDQEIDSRVRSRALVLGKLMAGGMLQYRQVANRRLMTNLVGDDLVDAMVVGANHKIIYSFNPVPDGADVSQIAGLTPDMFPPSLTDAVVTLENSGPDDYLVSLTPIFIGNAPRPTYYIYLKVSTNQAALERTQIRRIILAGIVACVMLTSLTLILCTQWFITGRLADILNGLKRVEAGDLDARVDEGLVDDEISKLQRGVNSMAAEFQKTFQALGNSERRLQDILDYTPSVIFIKDLEGRYLLTNRRYQKLLDRSETVLLGRTDDQIHPREMARQYQAHDREVQESERPHEFEEIAELPDGFHYYVSAKFPVRNTQGDIYGVGGILTDITPRKRAETALAESERTLDSIIKTIPDIVYRLDVNGCITFISEAVTRYGYRPEELFGQPILSLVIPEDRELAKYKINERRTGRRSTIDFEIRLLTRFDTSVLFETRNREFSISAQGLYRSWPPQQNSFLGTQGIARDITERKAAEEAFLREAERFRVLIEQSPHGVSLVHADGRYEYLNPTFIQMFGYGLSDVPTGADWFKKAFPDEQYRKQVIAAWFDDLKRLGPGVARPRTFTISCKDGSEKIVTLRPVTLTDGKQLVIHEDVTDRRKTEEALRESEARHRMFLDLLPEPLVAYDMKGKVIYTNQAFHDTFGWSSRELLNRKIDFVPPEAMEETRRNVQDMLQGRRIDSVETIRLTKDGRRLNIYLNTAPFYDHEGRQIGNIVILRDITALKQAQASLIESEERFRAILEANPNPMVVYDSQGRTVYINPAFTRVFHWEWDELKGKRIPFVPEEARKATLARIKELYASGRSSSYECRRLTQNGVLLDVGINAAGIKDPEGQTVGMVVNITDITERKRLERQVLHSQKMEAVGTLTSGIAHDFNNILQAITGYVELVRSLVDGRPKAGNYLEEIDQIIHRAAELVNRLLTFSRRVETNPVPLDLNAEILQTARILERIIPKMIEIELDLETGLSLIKADATQLEQVLLNLGTNAKDAMPDGGRLLIQTRHFALGKEGAGSLPEVLPGEYVMLTVSDTGHGMDDATVQHLFEPFFTTKSVGHGTGLGLSIVYGIVKTHGGAITCESRPGQGASFRILFPALPQGRVPVRPPAPLVEELPWGDQTILIVDDEEAIRETAGDFLNSYGYTIYQADSGESALEIYSRMNGDIDLVIMDLGMPGMGGLACLKKMVEMDPEVKVIIATGYSAEGQARETLEAGAAGFIRKPYRLADIMRKVRDVLDG